MSGKIIQTSRRNRDQWKTATCRQEQYQDWAREHHASMWDYKIEDELPKARDQRLSAAKQLCLTCPLRADCDAHYQTVVSQSPYGVGGVWGGRVYADKTGAERFDSAPAAA